MDRFRQADVTFWGSVALACAGFAVVSANLSAAFPPNLMAGLHATRTEGGNFDALRAEVATLQEEILRARQENGRMMAMITTASKGQTDIAKRVGSLEDTLPVLLESGKDGRIAGIAPPAGIDTSAVTASIGGGVTHSQDVEGGSVTYSIEPLFNIPGTTESTMSMPAEEGSGEAAQPMPMAAAEPPELEPVTTDSYGMAMGPAVSVQDSYLTWVDIRNKVGALLMGMEPILGKSHDGDYRLVVGPVDAVSQAEDLCKRINNAGVQCLPAPYDGYALPR